MQQSFAQAIAGNDNGAYQGSLGTGENAPSTTTEALKDCTTPRGETVADKDFVLAYEQRADVNTMCNVERRVCSDGVLDGSYVQKSCKEDVVYEYERVKAVSYNEPVVNPLVQPS